MSDQRQINKQLANGLEELAAQIDDVSKRMSHVESAAQRERTKYLKVGPRNSPTAS